MQDFASHLVIAGSVMVLAMTLGATIAHTNFCTMGAVADWTTSGDRRRLQAWLLAMAVAIAGAAVLRLTGVFDPAATRIPYASTVFAWPRYLLGGLVFGVGMALSAGCPSRNLVRAGMGSGKALCVLIVAAIAAYLMTRMRGYEFLFHRWMAPLFVDLARFDISDQRLPSILGAPFGMVPAWLDALLTFVIAIAVAACALVPAGLRTHRTLLAGGLLIGAIITAGWWLSAGPIGQRWIEDAEFLLEVPAGIGVQSFTFIGPLAELGDLIMAPTDAYRVTFGVAGIVGMLTGAFGYALCRRRLRRDWFQSFTDCLRQLCGGALLGIGGILALGCSIGQGITGISTLACGSMIAVAAMMLGCALTIRTEYYRLVYTADAGWVKAFIAAAADLRILPARCRRLARLS